MEKEIAIHALHALAHDTRLDVFRLLVVAGPAGLSVGAIGERLGVAPATLNHHLTQLKTAGLVTVERAGRTLIHRAAFDRMDALIAYLTENCCEGSECASPTPATERAL